MCSARGLIFIIITNERVYAHDISLNAGAFESKSVALPLIHTTRPSKIMMAFSAPRGERDPLLTLVESSSSSSSNIREEKIRPRKFPKETRVLLTKQKRSLREQKRKKKKFKDRRMARIKRFTMFSRTPRCSY